MNAKLLVADESPTIHKIVAMAFEKEGMTVEGISRGEHVLEYMVEFQPDIVLADINLPGLDGYQLSREIKNSKPFSHTRVVLLTSDFEDVDPERLKESLADDTISKPFKSEEIRNKVKAQLEAPKPERKTPAEEHSSPPEPETTETQPTASQPPSPVEITPGEVDVVEKEYEDIVGQAANTREDPGEPAWEEIEEPTPSPSAKEEPEMILEGIDSQASSEPAIPAEPEPEPARAEAEESAPPPESAPAAAHPAPPGVDENSSKIIAQVSEEAIQAHTRALEEQDDDFEAVFEWVQSSSPLQEMDLADLPPREPGSKPNLIEEALALMAHRHLDDAIAQPESRPPETGTLAEPETSAAEPPEETSPELMIEPVAEETRSVPDLSLGRRLVEAHVDQVKERLPEGAAREEVSAALEQTVRQVLGELGPEIVRKVIQDEIEAIKKMQEA